MQFVGNKNEIYASVLPASGKFPELKIAEFQSLFQFLSNETEASILHQAKMSRIKVHQELKTALDGYGSLMELSLAQFGEEESGVVLYTQAVFALTAAELISIQVSGDATAEAADRQEALTDKRSHSGTQYRQAIDLLLHGEETYCFEVV